jgi:hypothetical protein
MVEQTTVQIGGREFRVGAWYAAGNTGRGIWPKQLIRIHPLGWVCFRLPSGRTSVVGPIWWAETAGEEVKAP